jgi:hypothetical protein
MWCLVVGGRTYIYLAWLDHYSSVTTMQPTLFKNCKRSVTTFSLLALRSWAEKVAIVLTVILLRILKVEL